MKAEAEIDACLDDAYAKWADQFPMAAAARQFFAGTAANGTVITIPCGRPYIRERFRLVARSLGISVPQALDVLGRDLWVLNEPEEVIVDKVQILRAKAESDEDVLNLLRLSPKLLGMTSAKEMRQRGLEEMRARATLDELFDLINTPLRLWFSFLRKLTAQSRAEVIGEGIEKITEEQQEALRQNDAAFRDKLSVVFFGGLSAILVYLSYMDATYGGPIHSKGICIPSVIPTFNIPDAEGNARLPCNCAPIYKWYIEPALSADQREGLKKLAPKVESKNCGRLLTGEKRVCDPTTVGGCVWTAADLERDPTFWDKKPMTSGSQRVLVRSTP